MEPLDDNELNDLLRKWEAPGAPAGLAARVLPRPAPWWQWFASGSIRVPVPVGIALVMVLAGVLYFRAYFQTAAPPAVARPAKSVSLADFQPVKQLEPKVIGRANESN